jgi:prephenate dehydrogenase
VEPVQQVLGLRIEVAGQVADVFAAVGEEGDLLVGLHPLAASTSNSRRFRFAVVGLHVPETR